jgi:hypothetical protein
VYKNFQIFLVKFIVTDNGSNIVSAVAHLTRNGLGLSHIRCAAHILNLIIKRLFKKLSICSDDIDALTLDDTAYEGLDECNSLLESVGF